MVTFWTYADESGTTLTNSAYPDEMPHDGISPVYKCKKSCTEKYISQLKCSGYLFLKDIFVTYAFPGCNLRVGKRPL